ncbi:hypothetical protein HY522_03955, partial [bacterium]|nr:hypothetical protein [bacterium]
RLGFAVEMDTHQSIVRNREKILRCPKARLLEELMILLKYNSAERSMRLLWQFGLMEFLLPMHHQYLVARQHIPLEPPRPDLLYDLLSMLDLESPMVEPPVLFALLIFPFLVERLSIDPKEFWCQRAGGALIKLIEDTFNEMGRAVDISKRFRSRALEILLTQGKLYIRQSRIRPEKLAYKPYFPDSLRFFQIAARAVDFDAKPDLAVWKKFADVTPRPDTSAEKTAVAGAPAPASPSAPDHRRRNHRRRRRHGRGSQSRPPQQSSPANPSPPAA